MDYFCCHIRFHVGQQHPKVKLHSSEAECIDSEASPEEWRGK